MEVDLVEAEVNVVLDVLEVLVEVGAHENPVLEVLDTHLLGHRREVLGVPYVGLGEGHPAVGPLFYGLLFGLLLAPGPGDVELDHARHRGRVFVRPTRALLELLHEHLDLLVGSTHGDDPITELPGPAALDGARGRDVDGRRRLGHRVEPGALEPDVLPPVLDYLPREQLADDLYRLHEDAQARGRLGPVLADYVLVEGLPGPETQPEAPRVHRLKGGRGLGDYRRVVAEAGRGHPGPEA